MPPRKRASTEAGRVAVSTGGMKAAAAIGRNALSSDVNVESPQTRQRATVRRSIPSVADNCRRRVAVSPWHIAEINVTTVAR